MAINESKLSCWSITLFSSEWKLGMCLNLPVQAVRRVGGGVVRSGGGVPRTDWVKNALKSS